MFEPNQYRLIDFGNGRKLESFNGIDVLRSCPAAEGVRPAQPSLMANCELEYCQKKRAWTPAGRYPADWSIRHGDLVLGLKPTPFGHLGVFAEQADNWTWLDSIASRTKGTAAFNGATAINLFAYTGGSTLKLASLGARVVHVDSAKTVVNWARNNAELSGLSKRPVRWIVDDAMTFLQREVRRGNRYDVIVADPPAFGHGGKKASWKIDRDLPRLISLLAEVCQKQPLAVLITWHSQGISASDVGDLMAAEFGNRLARESRSLTLDLVTGDGRKLNCGNVVRWAQIR